MFNSFQQAEEYIEQQGVKMLDFKMVDINGRWRHLTLPAESLTSQIMRYGLGFDGSNYGYMPVEKSDMVFIPDLSSAIWEPFAALPTLSMIGDVHRIEREGKLPFEQYPRNVARAAEAYMRESGLADQALFGPEFELNIFDRLRFTTRPERVAVEIGCEFAEWSSFDADSHGYQVPHKGGYHVDQPQDFTFDLRNEICELLTRSRVPVKYHHTEVAGPGQVEFELQFGPMTEMADRSLLLKYIVKNAALKAGKTATFMPKPIYDEAGNGMHVHMLLFKQGAPLFYDPAGYSGLSQTALWFIGGILRHVAGLCALTNPSTNSYKRLVPGYEAPVTVGFATANRSAVIRIPDYARSPEAKRFELRSIDATCNPYYAFAALLMAGLDGVERKIDPVAQGWGPFDFNLYNLPAEEKAKLQGLPTDLRQAVSALKADHDYLLKGNVFSEALLEAWCSRKLAEADEIDRYPHPAEFRMYYDL